MRVALTGATGFLGSHLLARFLARGAEAVALVRDDGPAGRRRLRRALAATGTALPEDWERRVRLVRTDVTRPDLGLSAPAGAELAAGVDEWWHSAGLIDLTADDRRLDRVNVGGTRHLLDFLRSRGARGSVVHISTAYVAGGRLDGLVRETDLDGRNGFLTPYERSKYRAERLVRAWARRHDRPVTVWRPAVLVTSRLRPPTAPRHPLADAGARLSLLTRYGTVRSALATAAAGPLRFPGRPDATMNLLPVEYAAEVMAGTLGRTPLTPTDTLHLTHPRETPVRRVLAAVRQNWPGMHVLLDPACTRLGPVERVVAGVIGGITAYSTVRRAYDRTLLETILPPALSPPPETDMTYLRQALRPPASFEPPHVPHQEISWPTTSRLTG
ncbi:SDR family oxidoreductase [Streptomyces sp. URMC 123]|uniref:SDR family oxidoreductase n=1 Tax=Streptomyces sp. URMC 123 TaxID=3423403 RepID=UPI003F1C2C3C